MAGPRPKKTTPVRRWMDEQGVTLADMAALIEQTEGERVTPEAVQHWVSGRRPVPRRYRRLVDILIEFHPTRTEPKPGAPPMELRVYIKK
jgi:aminoglycoside phosphotransferase (APT) family kinase protein